MRQQFLEYTAARIAAEPRYAYFCNELKYVRRLVASTAPRTLLDIGCGSGVYTEFWTEQGFEAHGIDVDSSLVVRAKERLQHRGAAPRLAVGRVETLPYASGAFDVCIANSVLEHVPDWQALLQEASRVLKDGGLLILSTTNRLHPFQGEINRFPFYPWLPAAVKARILDHITSHRPDLVNYTDRPAVNWFSYEELKAFLTGLGYCVSTRLDLMRRSDLRGWKAVATPGLGLMQSVRCFRYLYYLYAADVSVYALKDGRGRIPGREAA